MKKTLFFLATISLLVACSQPSSYKITGDITGHEGTIYLKNRFDAKCLFKDSTELVDGKFIFKGSVKSPELYYIFFKNDWRGFVPFIIENSDIHIKADISNLPLNSLPSSNLPLMKIEITGSASEDVMKIYKKTIKEPYYKKNEELKRIFDEAYQVKKINQIKETYATIKKVQEDFDIATKKYIENNNKSLAVALIALKYMEDKEADEIDEIVGLIDASLLETYELVAIKKRADLIRNSSIGKIAPDFTLNDIEGNPITLSSLYGKGYILVDFWASWCHPCRAENPNVVAEYNKYHDIGLQILSVSYDSKKENWLKAIEKDQLPWLHVSALKGWKCITKDLYNMTGVPYNVLLDKEGKIIAKNLMGYALEEKLAELLDK